MSDEETLKLEVAELKAKLEALQGAVAREIKGARNLFPNLTKALRNSRTREGEWVKTIDCNWVDECNFPNCLCPQPPTREGE